ncbi:HlyD family type I secretion periplasmic adaptor subunit [Microvirga sesbaniae]|uniref:HlyD family type I secretion periplasmic adaptor subunit n=1 Tax=Microvirga sesbaniae TaxID=681392 RepID=UPI0021C8B3B9|nr:HlyD family type I secretion periplasmic adaptor subunit [Microvirga sp. HBU67692]
MTRHALVPRAAIPLEKTHELVPSTLLEFESPTAALLAVPVQPAASRMLWTVVSLVAACVAAGALIPVDMVVTAPGRVVSMQPTIMVQPLETAIVRAINVREGQVVRAGETLARLDPTFSAADVDALEAQVRSYQAEVDRLSAEASNTAYRPSTADAAAAVQAALYGQRQAQYRSLVEGYTQKINSVQAQLTRAEGDVKAYTERLAIASELESKRRELERLQVGSQMNRLVAQDQRIEMARNLTDATGNAERARRELQQTLAERDSFRLQWQAQVSLELSERTRSLTDAKESLRKATLRHQLVDLRAEQDAIVLNVGKVSVGSVMQSGEQFITLVPLNSRLEVEAHIAGADAGFVNQGEKVVIKFDTFPYVRYGVAEGSVRTVSADSFTGGDDMRNGAALGPGPQPSAYYKSRIAVDEIKMHDVPGGFQLKPGMPVTADINVGQRTVLTYLFSRILPVGTEGMREPW